MYFPSEFQFGSRLAFRLGASGESVFRFSIYLGATFSIPRHAPVESDQSDEWLSFRLEDPFNYQSPLASDVHPVNASRVPTQLIESTAHTAQEIVEASGNPESSENRASIVAVRVCRSDGRELMRRGRLRANGTGYVRMRANR
jgi:hypothetical protein